MNIWNCALILFLVASISSCDNAVDDTDNVWENIDCDNLKTGIINIDSDIVKFEINKLVTDLEPVGTDSVRLQKVGHINVFKVKRQFSGFQLYFPHT